MKAISIRQPWAKFICIGKKSVEIRTWKTSHRGPILIHTGKNVDTEASLYYGIKPTELYTGGIIGVADLREVIETDDLKVVWDVIKDDTMEYVNYQPKQVGWVFASQKIFEVPIPYWGLPGVFDYVED